MRRRLEVVGIGVLAVGCGWFALGAGIDVAAAENTGVMTGVVTSTNGREAGVWVIAESDDLDTKFRKIVVTNDEGNFVLPELPAARYTVWVRGYGLVDSTPVTATPGQDLSLTAVVARTPQEAAQAYPANYWVSLLEPPTPSEFPGTGPDGNGINPAMQTQAHWINNMKACQRCHQVGNKITREIPDKDYFDSALAAWDHRVQRGQRAALMNRVMNDYGRQRGLQMFADWTERIAAGEVPDAPPRPTGVERNVVITMWNWADNMTWVHDEAASDKRHPDVNANGPVYGLDISNDYLLIVDPVEHTSLRLKVPLRTDRTPEMGYFPQEGFGPYRYFGEQAIWDDPANPHNPMLDRKGRVWMTTQIRPAENPVWCADGANHKFAKYFPLERAVRHAGYYDPDRRTFVLVDTCFGTHHLQFAEDDNDTLYFSGDRQVVGWINTKLYDQTGDERISQGWCPTVLDTNADGTITKPWNEPGESVDPQLDTRVSLGSYGVIVSPVDGSVWSAPDQFPGVIYRLDPGDNPPETCITEHYRVPVELGYRPRGIDVDRNGVLWTALAGSSHFASFDRRKCTVLNGPTTLDGRHCDDGWKFYRMPGVSYKGTTTGTDFHYYNWVDQFNTLGLGENIPIATGSGSDSLLALKPETSEWVVLRVPYPLGFHMRGLDGRIDDPQAGWKGRGVWSTYAADAGWHVEGGPDEKGNLVKFQIRPDPLAR